MELKKLTVKNGFWAGKDYDQDWVSNSMEPASTPSVANKYLCFVDQMPPGMRKTLYVKA